ncbi:proliferating cell nuclear antigen, N-terminal domain-containing protein [Blyttiomyces helicus]|uniref:DNA sliding clamp PCNA n=1 Tax=Blyttiomyces helicus TaxID=388810 RepID=A0A4P9WP76_9FUNG|nr:proliferating cell nuclear antigen, N-terminal domain-containing protein [Blyttiomyces helicus]|eukprot:RKO93030.1 proliferating cell nuclear antigen, N-terminal domain-containing protein [Blyttiomyces helicus]
MLEARLERASVLKKLLDAIKELVTDANFDCTDSGIALQAMDNSHVALVALLLRAQGFDHYRCDHSHSLGLSVKTLASIVKTAGNDDSLTIKSEEDGDVLNLIFASPDDKRVSEFDLKLMDIDAERLGIPETDYDAIIKLSSAEFARICRDLLILNESVTIDCQKEHIKFTAAGDTGSGSIKLMPGSSVDDERDEKDEKDKKKLSVPTQITTKQAVVLTFSLKYLASFAKATPLSETVTLMMSTDTPLVVEFKVDEVGYIRYYLAPKIDDA